MNHIYKVIWNKARNAYVVVSEFAKGYSRNTTHSQVTHSAAILRLAVLLACTTSAITVGAPLWVQAAATVDAGTTTNGDANTLAVGSGSSANGKGALAVGGGSRASGDTAVALAWGSQALSDYAIAIGHSAHVGGSYTYSQGGNTGLGSTAFNAIAIGNTSTANGQNDVVIGANNTAATPTAAYYETDKTGNSSAIALGGRILIGHDNDATGRADNATVLGSNNVVNAPHGIAIGQNLQSGQASASGIESNNTMVLGVNSKALSSNSIALGNGATAGNSTNSGNAYGQGAVAIGESANSTAYYSVALGHNAQATNAMSVAIGDGSQASGWTSSAVGNGAKAEGYASVSMGVGAEAEKDYAVSMGAGAEASGENSIAIGGKGAHKAVEGNEVKTYYVSTQATGTSSVAIGRETTAAGNYSLAMGYLASVAKGATSGIALGDQTTTYGVNSVAIGAGATVGTDSYKKNVSGGVALGSGSDVFRDFKSQNWSTLGTTWTNWMDMKNPTNSHENVKWAATLGAVSIGSDGEEGTDALPASFYTTRQLTGLAAGTYDTDAVNVAQWKNTMLATVGDAQGSMYNSNYGTDGVNRNLTRLYDEQLTLTGAGDNGTALTKEQMSTVANIGTIVDDNKITFRLAKDITGLDSVTTGNTKMESKGITITNTDDNKKSITLDGSTGRAVIGGVTVGYVNDGELETSKHAIVPSGNYVYHLTNTTWDPSTYVSGRAATEDQLYSLGSAVTSDINNIEAVLGNGSFGLTADDNASTSTNLGSTIKVKGDGTNITTKVDGTDLQIELNKHLNLGVTGSVKMGNTTINNGGVTITNPADANKPVSLTDKGLNNGGNKITNIAAGDVSEGSTDAVNGSQLHAVEQKIQDVEKTAGQHTTVEAGSTNVSVTEDTNGAGGKKYTVDLATDVTFGSDANQIAINGTDGTVTVGTGDKQVKLDGTNGSVTAGGVTINKDSKGTIDGLTNTTWTEGAFTSGQAATEDQLHTVESNVNKKIDNINTAIENVDKHHTEVKVNGEAAPATEGTYTEGNLQIAQTTADDGHKIYDLKLSDTLNIGGAGKDGAPGQDGHMGINGADGKSGVAIDGKDGISIKGQDGKKDGVTIKGIDGKDGVDGAEGHIGLNGKDGITDIWTTAGTPGLNGQDGETMTRIVYQNPNGDTHEAATLDDGLKFGGDFGTASAVKLNKQVNVKGNAQNEADLTDGNIGVVSSQDSENGQLLIKLNKDLNLGANGSVTMGNTLLNGSGLTLSGADENSKIQISQGNVSVGGQQIHNVANGTNDADAVNLSQLNEIKNAGANGGFGLKADDGNSVKKNLGETVTVKGDGTNISTKVDKGAIQVELNKDINLGTDGSVTAGHTTINGDGVTTDKVTVGHITITKDGINGGQQQITNIGSGIDGQIYDTQTPGQENWNNAASVGDVHTIARDEAGKAADAVKAKSGKNITVDADNKVNLNDDITLGKADDAFQQVKINGEGAKITAGDGANQVTVDGSQGQVTIGSGDKTLTLGKQANTAGDSNPAEGNYLTSLDNKTWDPSHIQSGRAATEDQLKVVDDKISGGRKFTGDDGQQLTVGLGQNLSLTGGAQADNLSDGNIGVVKNGDNGLSVKLSKDLKDLNSVTTGNTTVDNNGLTIKTSDADRTISIADGNVNMGGNTVSGVDDGRVAQGSTDAVNGGQLWQRDQAINSLGGAVNKLDSRVNRVGAGAAALATLHPLDFDPDDKWDFAAGYGNYKDASAVAVGAYYRPNEDTMFSIGGSFGGGENMVNAGVSFKLGQGNHVSTSRVAMAKEIKDLRKEIEGLRSALADVAAGNRLDPTKTKLFPDIPQNHWAYNEIAQLYGNGIVQGYPDGNFGGDRMMTRYEFALMVYRQMQRGAALSDRIVNEFEPELERIRIDTITKDKDGNPVIQRVRVIKDRG